MRAALALAALPFLAGCAADNMSSLVSALSKDSASVCGSITTAFPPWASTLRVCRTNGQAATVTVDPAGNMVMTTPNKPPQG